MNNHILDANFGGTLEQTSLIICSRNRPAMLGDTVASVLQGQQLPAELIIIDQSDAPHPQLGAGCAESGCDVRYVWTPLRGLSRANNFGAALARHDWLVFTHDDVFVAPTWFGTLVRALRDGGPKAVVTGRVLPTKAEVAGGFAPALKTNEAPAVYRGRVGVDVLKPLNMALHRAALVDIGGFDVRLGPGTPFPGAEDSDLGFRLLEAGYRVLYVPAAVVYHRAWRRERDYLPLRWHYGRAQGAFFAKHLKAGDLYMLRRLLRDVRRRSRRFPRRLWYEPKRALGDPLFILGNLVGAATWFWRGRRTGAAAASDEEIRQRLIS